MSGANELVLATNAFGMGVDKEDIRYVIHAEVPGSMESYYQEIGRSGRDGLDSTCALLYDQRDLEIQMQFLRWGTPGVDYYHRVYHLLAERTDEANAFGVDWMRKQIHNKDRANFTLETALSMLHRYGATEGEFETKDLRVVDELPEPLMDRDRLEQKRRREQERLYALVMYTKEEGDRKAFIHKYFGLDVPE